jgi:glycosyltransferase involved in cell wall biosynthesis
MRILAVCFSPPEGAIADPFSAVINEISKDNEVTVISPYLTALDCSQIHHINILYEPSRPISFFSSKGLGLAYKQLKNQQFDAVFWFSTNIANIVILPFVHTKRHYMWCHEPRPKNRTTFIKRVLYKINDTILSFKSKKVIVAGLSVARMCPIGWSHKLEICPIPSIEKFDHPQATKSQNSYELIKNNGSVFRVVFFGGLQPYKGLDVLALAFREVIGANLGVIYKLEILGSGNLSYFPHLISLRDSFPELVTINNTYVPSDYLYESVKCADAAVFPYLTATGTTVLNIAFGLNCLVIASDVGNFADHIRDGENGFLVCPGDVGALAQRIVECSLNIPMSKLIGQRGRSFFENELTAKVVGEKLLNIFRS